MKEEIDYQFYKYLEQNDQVQPKQEIEKKLIRARNGERWLLKISVYFFG